MSSAFVRENDYQQLKDVPPNMASLLLYLRRENGGAVHELRRRVDEQSQREVYDMSDGLSYALNNQHQWEVILD